MLVHIGQELDGKLSISKKNNNLINQQYSAYPET